MTLTIEINGEDFTGAVPESTIDIQTGINGVIGSAKVTVVQEGAGIAKYGFGTFGTSKYSDSSGEIESLDTIIIKDADTLAVQFQGFVTAVSYRELRPDVDFWELTCQDRNVLLETTLITDTWTSKTAAFIIQDAFGTELASVDTTNVVDATVIDSFEAKDMNLRSLLRKLRAATGANWYLSQDLELHWFLGTEAAASFGLADNYDEVTTWPLRFSSFTRDYADRANRITYLGGVVGGSELTTTVEDTAHQAAHGVYELTLVDRDIQTSAFLALAAAVELTRRTSPLTVAHVVTDKTGLALGEALTLRAAAYGLSEAMIIKGINMSVAPTGEVEYMVKCGDHRPDLVELLQRQNETVKTPVTPVGEIEDGSVTEPKLASSAVTESKIASAALGDGLTKSGGQVVVAAGDGLEFSAGSLLPKLAGILALSAGDIVANLGDGVENSGGNLQVKVSGNGVELDGSGNVGLKLGAGVEISANNLTTKLGNGLTFSGNEVVVNAGDGVEFSVGKVQIKASDGLQLSGGFLKVKTNSTYISTNASGELEVDGVRAQDVIAGQLIAGVTMVATQVISGEFTGCTMTLTNGGITTKMNNATYRGNLTALYTANGSGYDASIRPGVFECGNSSNVLLASMFSTSGYGRLALAASNGASKIIMSANGTSTGNFINVVDGSYEVDGSTVINESKQFVGAGVAMTTAACGATAMNVYQSGWYYGVTGPTTFTTVDSKTVTVRGGVIVSIV
jgi:hypothetical protein